MATWYLEAMVVGAAMVRGVYHLVVLNWPVLFFCGTLAH